MTIAHLIVDVETGGLSPERHSLLEIGWAFCDAEWKVLDADSLGILPQPGKIIEKKAADLNGYTEEYWAQYEALPLDQAAEKFVQAVAPFTGDICYAHNVSFDEQWLRACVPAFHCRIREWRCSMKSLREYCTRHGIKLSKGTQTLANGCKIAGHINPEAHGAMHDCIAAAAIMRHCSKSSLLCR
jgi:DNA polymerase III epsilon subunit-like protein